MRHNREPFASESLSLHWSGQFPIVRGYKEGKAKYIAPAISATRTPASNPFPSSGHRVIAGRMNLRAEVSASIGVSAAKRGPVLRGTVRKIEPRPPAEISITPTERSTRYLKRCPIRERVLRMKGTGNRGRGRLYARYESHN